MSSLRQLGSGLLYALVSIVLVVGGLSLALAEGGFNTPAQTAQPTLTVMPPSATGGPESITSTPVVSTATATSTANPSATLQPLIVTATSVPPSATTYYASPRPTWTRIPYRSPVPCGPYSGWLLSYIVQPGDTLFHIATQYRTTVTALQIANCKPSTVIFPGERLWVPNLPTVTPGLTLIPTFPTQTPVPTEPLTLTPVPSATDTAVPTDTTVPPNP